MTRDVGQHLRGFQGPRLLAVVHFLHINLRVLDAADNAELQTFYLNIASKLSRLMGIQPTQPARNGIIRERATQGIAHLVRESSNAWHLRNIGLHAQLFVRQRTGPCTPTLAINQNRRIQLVEFGTDGVHGLNIVTTHQVETETVNAILVIPVLHRLNHKLAHHWLVRCRLVATA